MDIECDACDGKGRLMYQWAKAAMLSVGGSKRPFTDGRNGFYYVNAEGKEMGMKTIGGPCGKCGGSGRLNSDECEET